MIRLLVLSLGSLVGKNILDCIETRKEDFCVIGTNTAVFSPHLQRANTLYTIPKTFASGHLETILTIIECEQPDLILPGRDDDVLFLAALTESHPELRPRIVCGASAMAGIICDKLKTAEFAQLHQLPMAASCLVQSEADLAHVEVFANKAGWPLICKQPRGFGSNAVKILPDLQTLNQALPVLLEQGPCLLQEYLNPPANLEHYLEQWRLAPPLFFQIPETSQYAAQTVIAPDGSFAEFCLTLNTNVMGRTEYSERVEIPELEQFARQWAHALSQNGWRGSLNLQCKQDQNKQWKLFELGGRLTGSSSARLWMGYDEIALLLQAFRPDLNYPIQAVPDCSKVYRQLSDQRVLT